MSKLTNTWAASTKDFSPQYNAPPTSAPTAASGAGAVSGSGGDGGGRDDRRDDRRDNNNNHNNTGRGGGGGGRNSGRGGRGRGGGRGGGGRNNNRDRGGRGSFEPRPTSQYAPKQKDMTITEATSIESKFGLSAYLSPQSQTFQGVLKARFSDFIVHEVDFNGDVAELKFGKEALAVTMAKGMVKVDEERAAIESATVAASVEKSEEISTDTEKIETVEKAEETEDEKKINSAAKLIAELFPEPLSPSLQSFLVPFTLPQTATSPTQQKFYLFPAQTDKTHRGLLHNLIKTHLSDFAVADTDKGGIRLYPMCFRSECTSFIKDTDNNNNNNSRKRRRGDTPADKIQEKIDEILKTSPNSWPSDRPQYVRFVLYKENVDTMQAVKDIQNQLNLPRSSSNDNSLGFSGTKDKRAVTSQFITIHKKTMEQVDWLNNLFNRNSSSGGGGGSSGGGGHVIRMGNFSYCEENLRLGSLQGNTFDIVLRNLSLDSDASAGADADAEKRDKLIQVVNANCKRLSQTGFINYYGMQRFGKFFDTHEVGLRLMKNDYEAAVDVIMRSNPDESPDIIEARDVWTKRDKTLSETDMNKVALKCERGLTRYMLAEKALMQHLSRTGKDGDFKGAFNAVQKNMKLMYLHAVQSMVFNKVASRRVEIGSDVCVGDLVYVGEVLDTENSEDNNSSSVASNESNDEEGKGEFRKTSALSSKTVYALTSSDVASGKYSLSDIVLPLPGNSVTVPSNLKDAYCEVLKDIGLIDSALDSSEVDLKSIFTNSEDTSLSLGGDYRKLICKMKNFDYKIKEYKGKTEPLVVTDLMKSVGEGIEAKDWSLEDKIKEKEKSDSEKVGEKEEVSTSVGGEGEGEETGEPAPIILGLVVSFTLPSSAYATMALRELTKIPQMTEYQKGLRL